ncbi:MAG: hypothetical protein LUO97_03115 [Methanomicrobiales archaeon]|nr:hypothetical protein [Methanomicrobiales archaeon]
MESIFMERTHSHLHSVPGGPEGTLERRYPGILEQMIIYLLDIKSNGITDFFLKLNEI